jgi:hypothetical protein
METKVSRKEAVEGRIQGKNEAPGTSQTDCAQQPSLEIMHANTSKYPYCTQG